MKIFKVVSGYSCVWLLFACFLVSCNNAVDSEKSDTNSDSLSETQKHLPENALSNLIIS